MLTPPRYNIRIDLEYSNVHGHRKCTEHLNSHLMNQMPKKRNRKRKLEEYENERTNPPHHPASLIPFPTLPLLPPTHPAAQTSLDNPVTTKMSSYTKTKIQSAVEYDIERNLEKEEIILHLLIQHTIVVFLLPILALRLPRTRLLT
ncbi:hypothetical protein KSP39_PZI011951 [Platanthera zijinensis]|uniref:Uncharacterized protein n=1 Tax=Platanthera zijinensis TaxID=2320716 RepID=A0AAP0G555_9ASPA